ncbi:MAG: transporter substrate-binding domain-containing protein [Ideonella sp.]
MVAPPIQPTAHVIRQLAPSGSLRAGINLSNFLLVTGRDEAGAPTGVAPDLARAIADRLGVGLTLVPFASPGALADAAGHDAWDIGLIGADPARAHRISFSAAYAQIAATYLVPASSELQHVSQVDRPGVRIAAYARSAYHLWLVRHVQHAELVIADSIDAAFDLFVEQRLDALACLTPRLLTDVQRLPGARILQGEFMVVQQAVGTHAENAEAARFLRGFVEEAKASGLIAELIERHQVRGLDVAPPQVEA